MLVIDSKRAVVLNTPKYQAVLDAVPHARVFEHEGKKLTAVPHGVEETKILRNLGFKKAPSPILFYYDWPGHNVAPMQHQKDTAAFLTLHKRALCLNAPGTGKSLSALWAADFLLRKGVASKILIVAPLSTVRPVWAKELRFHFPHLKFETLTGTKRQRLDALQRPMDVGIINHDGFTLFSEKLHQFDIVIYDEATALKSPSSRRFKTFYTHVNKYQPWLWLMTGTPVSQNPTDAWALAKLAGSPVVPSSFYRFKDIVMQRVTSFKWIPRPEATEICKKVLQPSIYYSLDECVDLPETVFINHECSLTKEQRDLFKEMREQAIITLHDINAPNAAVMFAKLIQICCGAAYNSDGDVVQFDAKNREDTLIEIIEEINDKVIVFVPLRGVQTILHTMLKKAGYDVAVVNGDVAKADRDKIFHEFQNTDRIKILLAHPKVAAHGLTLTRARDIIWYAPIYSLEQYEQANARIRRLVTKGKTRVHHIYATRFEKELYSRLATKKQFLSDLLSIVQGVNE
jgi:SNF2 family DNA or RNA helicase